MSLNFLNKKDRIGIKKCFDNICKNKQYVQHFKGVRIVSYNNEIEEIFTLQFTHKFNDFVYSKSYIFSDIFYTEFSEEKLWFYFNLSLEKAFNKFIEKEEFLM